MRNLIAYLALALSTTAFAGYIPNTSIYYYPQKDAMTDENQGRLIVQEINDTSGSTMMLFQCRGAGSFEAYLITKNTLVTAEDYDANLFPDLMYRMDSQPAKTLKTDGATDSGEPDYNTLAFTKAGSNALFQSFVNGNKVAVRVLRRGLSALDYTFSAKSFTAGFKNVNNCK
ncbi:hypothetical protein Dxin01_00325 [Deinococcus xinjiangensis]|uniref:Uncharacterized protein n=1 Tax=Deinococcus xinjiangensis TaxID=457454 RepID=A0ABP9VBD7_9DEIO